jgi:hypothetical protein
MIKWVDRVVGLACSLIKRIKKLSLQSKEGALILKITTGLPKESNFYGNGSVILPAKSYPALKLHLSRKTNNKVKFLYEVGNTTRKGRTEVKLLLRQNYSGTVCTRNSVTKLDSLILRCKNKPYEKVDRPLYSIISDPYILELAYHKIKSKPGNMTPGITPETLDGISYEYFQELSEALRTQTFRFKPGRRIQIPKPSGGTRPLTIGSPRDKIVQEAIRIILNAIYEPIFLENSHGFRPNKGCHTALKFVYTKFKSTT